MLKRKAYEIIIEERAFLFKFSLLVTELLLSIICIPVLFNMEVQKQNADDVFNFHDITSCRCGSHEINSGRQELIVKIVKICRHGVCHVECHEATSFRVKNLSDFLVSFK